MQSNCKLRFSVSDHFKQCYCRLYKFIVIAWLKILSFIQIHDCNKIHSDVTEHDNGWVVVKTLCALRNCRDMCFLNKIGDIVYKMLANLTVK